jgi:peptidoglycan/LPS O-acetylase OafA/YrhL
MIFAHSFSEWSSRGASPYNFREEGPKPRRLARRQPGAHAPLKLADALHMPLKNRHETASRMPEIDGLRGVAILSVMFWHYFAGAIPTQPGTIGAYLLLPFSLTNTGVHLFFVLSGFLIGGILLGVKDSETYFKTFYVRRALRILPLYWLLTTAYVVDATYSSLPFMFNGAAPAPIYYFLLQDLWIAGPGHGIANGFSHTWSLAVEEQFYLMLPLLLRFMPRRMLIATLVAIIVFTPVQRYNASADAAAYTRFANMDFFAFGVLTAMAHRERMSINPKLLFAIFAVIYGLMALHRMPFPLLHPTMLGVAYTCLVLAILNNRTIVSYWPLRQAGIMCFGLYLFHIPVQALMFALLLGRADGYPMLTDVPSVLATLLSFTTTIALSVVSWRFIERPLVDYSHRWSYKDAIAPSPELSRGLSSGS